MMAILFLSYSLYAFSATMILYVNFLYLNHFIVLETEINIDKW